MAQPNLPIPNAPMPNAPTLPPPRKSSTAIVLTIVGGLAAAGAVAYAFIPSGTDEPQQVRNKYATQADCVRDYSPEQCTSEPSTTAPGQRQFYGPMFFPLPMAGLRGATDPGPGRFADRTMGTEPVRRGFGTTSRSFTSTGS